MLNKIATVFRKELTDALRDRKALSTILITPCIGLLMIFLVVQIGVYLQKSSQGFSLPVQNGELAVPMVQWLEEKGIAVIPAPENAVALVENDALDFVLIIPEDFPREFAEMKTATVELVFDKSRKEVNTKINTVKMALREWALQIGALRLVVKGVSPEIMSPIVVRDQDVSQENPSSAIIFSLVAMILTLTVFTTSIGVAIDMMAGEREKNSLEPLLLSPVSRWVILCGKWGNAMFISLVVLVLVTLSMAVMIPNLPMEKLGIGNNFDFGDAFALIVIALPLLMISTIIQLFVSIFSRSFKEAQSYIGLLIIIPMFAGYYVIWSDVSEPWQYYVPLMGTQMLMEDVLSKGYSATQNYWASTSVSLGLALLLAWITVVQLRREKIIYG